MKVHLLLLLLLLPICSAQKFNIQCHGEDFLDVRNQVLQCSSADKQACYTRVTGEKGCAPLKFCSREGWSCCHTDLCNI